MKHTYFAAVLACAAATTLQAQSGVIRQSSRAHCAATQAVQDSARDELLSVLLSDSPMMQETRRELGATSKADFAVVRPVGDGALCARVARAFPYPLRAGIPVVVLQTGPVLYVRDPDQRRSKGVVLDSTLHVVLRLDPVNP